MIAILSILAGGLVILGAVVGMRWWDARSWQGSLIALRLQFPRGLKADQISGWLGMLGGLRVPLALEIVATRGTIAHYLLVPETSEADVVAGTRGVLPGLRLEHASGYLSDRQRSWWAACELRITHLSHQLAADRAETAAAAFLGALGHLEAGEAIVVQWLLEGMPIPRPREASDPARELARAEKVKHSQPLMRAVGRVAADAATPGKASALLGRVVGTLHLLDAPGVAIVRRYLPTSTVVRRLEELALPLTVWPLAINVSEAVGLVGAPLGESAGVSGIALGRSRQLPPGQVPSSGGTTIAVSNYPGQVGQPLVLRPYDRLHHVYAVGPTGVGKSNLLAQMALGDAAAGHGVCLIDPKGDLVETILARIPDDVAERVVVFDPSQTDRPIGFNPLMVRQADEHARELAADRVLHIFRDMFSSFWGPRTDDILRAALLTAVNVPAPNGQAFTICEVPELLTSPALRQYVIGQQGLPNVLKTYWGRFDDIGEAEQLKHIGPVLNKLQAFTMRTATRLMLGQSTGMDFGEVMQRRLILLVSLAKGRIGSETATLAGSLLVAAFWQAALGRVALAPDERRPFFLFLDEFQDVVRLSESLPDLLSQARGLGIGAVLANQYVSQLPESVRAAVLGTARTQVAFQVEYDDARLLERRYEPSLAAADLMGQAKFEIALRPSVDGNTAAPVTGVTLPLGEPVRDAEELARTSRERWGRVRSDVEAGLSARVGTAGSGQSPPGRSYRRRAR